MLRRTCGVATGGGLLGQVEYRGMATFEVVSPIIVPTERRRTGARIVAVHSLNEFWDEARCGDRPGCYVFAIRHGRGSKPHYAGRTFGHLASECFQPHKLRKYDGVLADVLSGTPVMYLLPLVRSRGRVNMTAIESLEDTLIKVGLERNEDMANVSGTRALEVIVRGAWENGRGRRSNAARSFCRTDGSLIGFGSGFVAVAMSGILSGISTARMVQPKGKSAVK